MGKKVFCVLVVIAALGCGSKIPTVTMDVIAVNSPRQAAGEEFENLQRKILLSDLFLRHVSQKLELAKAWNLDEAAAVDRLRQTIQIEAANQSGRFLVTAPTIERALAAKIVNEICDFYVSQTTARLTGQGMNRLQVLIRSRAE